MASKSHTTRFGSKGASNRSMSFSEALLTGQPLQRDVKKYTPKLKPRPKARFGTKGLEPMPQDFNAFIQDHKQGWKFWR